MRRQDLYTSGMLRDKSGKITHVVYVNLGLVGVQPFILKSKARNCVQNRF